MKKGYIKQEDRKNILFLADDCRVPSGIGTMTREIIVGNAHRFNFFQLGAAIKAEPIFAAARSAAAPRTAAAGSAAAG